MQTLRALSILSLGLYFCSGALAQERQAQDTPLRRAERTFAAADRNRDGNLDESEITRTGIPGSVIRTWDHDRDQALSRAEFLLYYRQLMINAGQQPGTELDAEADRIAALRKTRDTQEERRRAREKELEELRGTREGETPEEKYRRARAALEARQKEAGKSKPAAESPEVSGKGDVQAATRARVARAQASLQAAGGGKGTSATETDQRSAAALALVRALDALETRARTGKWTREQFERARLDLILRARATRQPGASADEANAAALALARVLDAMESRARSGNWSREQYETKRQELILRARATAEEAPGSGEKTPPVRPEEPTELARALVRALDALENRARAGNWSREQYEQERFDLILRARAIPAAKDGAPGGAQARSRAALALTRALEAMEARARSGDWSREQYERKRIDLILRARASQAPAGGSEGAETAARPAEPADRDQAAVALCRALDALASRAQTGGWSDEVYERERIELIVRARGVKLGVEEGAADAAGARSRAAAALGRVLDALDDRARSGRWSREMYERERVDLILRARATQEESADPPPPTEERSNPALALVRVLDAMEGRARSGGWTREQFEAKRLELILRARGVDLGVAANDEAARTAAAQALARALDAMESRSRSGKWTRKQYEQKRVELIQRARGTSGEDAGSGESTPADRPERPTGGIDVKKVGGPKKAKRVPDKEKASGTGSSGAETKKTGADRERETKNGGGAGEKQGQKERKEKGRDGGS